MNAILPLPQRDVRRQKIAVVGSGISGSSAAWALAQNHDVTLFEAGSRFGGHTATVDIDYDGTAISVDTGFIVYNTLNYPLLTKLFAKLGVETMDSDMSFSLSLDDGKLEWNGDSLSTVFAQRKNIFSPSFLWMLKDVLRFNSGCIVDRASGYCDGITIGDYLIKRKYSDVFRDNYLIPMSAAIWSTPRDKMLDFPASTFIDFFANHRLINNDRPLWRTVKNGSRNYLGKLLGVLGDRAILNAPVNAIERSDNGVTIYIANRDPQQFDQVVVAAHSDQALKMLKDPSANETEILGAIKYGPNRVVLHKDASLMPKNKKCWTSWNAIRSSNEGDEKTISLTYLMNRLQSIERTKPLFVSLNPNHEPRPDSVFGEWAFEHPLFDLAAINAQNNLEKIQGVKNTWFAGAWTKYGFHEDGLRSGLKIASALNSPAILDNALPSPAIAAK